MLADEVEFHGPVKGSTLDDYLAKGWYRYGYMIFTTHFIAPLEDKKTYRAYWLRYDVAAVHLSKKITALITANKHLSITCRPFQLTAETDALHKRYVKSLKFTTNDNLAALLGDVNNIIYDTWIIELRDKGRLVAGGIFDRGEKSIAGIINFYDPEYRKHSLGKYLITLKYQYCLHNGLPYYYPGYYMPEHPLFDYKLFLDKKATEVYLPEQKLWIPFEQFSYTP